MRVANYVCNVEGASVSWYEPGTDGYEEDAAYCGVDVNDEDNQGHVVVAIGAGDPEVVLHGPRDDMLAVLDALANCARDLRSTAG